mmetsp:Transcript_21728/g.30372  ORF Transcript_21728/g.30372 Transcript_21728/m.30372 type:complete len:438 (+) Transcript_21728:3-1316(+)
MRGGFMGGLRGVPPPWEELRYNNIRPPRQMPRNSPRLQRMMRADLRHRGNVLPDVMEPPYARAPMMHGPAPFHPRPNFNDVQGMNPIRRNMPFPNVGMNTMIRSGRGRNNRRNGTNRNREPPPNPTNLYVENVPPNVNNMKSLSRHFERFGEIVNVQIDQDHKKAYVQFRTHEQAKLAISSPAAVCGNRFIKVKWAWHDPKNMIAKEEKLAKADSNTGIRIEKRGGDLKQNTEEMQAKKEKMLQMFQARMLRKIVEKQKRILKMLTNKNLKPEMRNILKEKYSSATQEYEKAMEEAKERKKRLEKISLASQELAPAAKNVLRISDIPAQLRVESALREHFSKYGTISSINLGGGNDEALVTFDLEAEAKRALEEGSKYLDVNLHIALVAHEEQKSKNVQAETGGPEVETIEFANLPKKEKYDVSDSEEEKDEDAWRR